MSKTPTFDAVVAESDPDLWRASSVFPLPVIYDHLPEYSMEGTSKADIRNAVRAGEPIPRGSRLRSEQLPASLADTPEPHITLIRERGAFQNVRDILAYSRNFLTPARAPHLWP
jgi:hypothetical protein